MNEAVNISKKKPTDKAITGGGFKAIQYVLNCAKKVGRANLAATVRSNNTCKACAFGTGGQRGGLHNEYSNRIEICNKNIQAHLSDIRDPIPSQIFEHNSIEELKALSAKQIEDLGRLATPLYKAKGDKYYQCISYPSALAKISQRLTASDPLRSFFYASGRSSNEAAFILQLFARIYGCNHINNCSYYCHQASGVGLNASIGTATATIQYQDLHKADLIFVFGANPASNHPRFVKVLLECRQRGGKVIVVNPAKEAGLVRFASPSNLRSLIAGENQVASHYIQPHIGGDMAFICGLAKQLLATDSIDKAFIDAHCSDFPAYEDYLHKLDWQQITQTSGVSQAEIEVIAQCYADSKRSVFSWGMGLTHHYNGSENVEAISNLALLRNMIAGEGKGLLPLRGHSNVQGVGSMGFTPNLKQQLFDAIEQEYGVSLPRYQGMDTLACVQAAAAGEIDTAVLLGGNLFSASPDSRFSAKALDNIPFKVMVNSTLNYSHVNGVEGENIILPIRVRDEETQATTQESMFNFVRLSDGGFNRIENLLSEVDIISHIASAVIPALTFDFSQFQKHSNIRQAIAKLIPGFEQLAQIDESKREFHIPGRKFSQGVFPTNDGLAHFRLPKDSKWRDSKPQEDFILSTVRSEGQFNTIIFSEEDVYRGQKDRQVLFINCEDIEQLRCKEGDLIDLYNSTGVLSKLRLAAFDIKRGNVMTYFPEANILVPQTVDRRSRTPGFKSVQVKLRRSSS